MNHIQSHQKILIVEDSDDDFESTMRGFKKTNFKNEIERCTDGQDALDYLYNEGAYEGQNNALPGIILLDLNMPGIDGRETLKIIKSDKKLHNIPVIILTTSADEHDIQDCYHDGANTFIQKPVSLEGLFDAIRKLKDYWFEIAVLPKV